MMSSQEYYYPQVQYKYDVLETMVAAVTLICCLLLQSFPYEAYYATVMYGQQQMVRLFNGCTSFFACVRRCAKAKSCKQSCRLVLS